MRKMMFALAAGFAAAVGAVTAPNRISATVVAPAATPNCDRAAVISWTPSAHGRVDRYQVWRRVAPGGVPALAGTVSADETSFTDTAAPFEVEVTYTVTAVTDGVESGESEAVTFRRARKLAFSAVRLVGGNVSGGGSLDDATDGDTGTTLTFDNGAIGFSFGDRHPVVTVGRVLTAETVTRAFIGYQASFTISGPDFGEANSFWRDADGDNGLAFESGVWKNIYPAARNVGKTWAGFRWGGYSGARKLKEFEIYGYYPDTTAVAAPGGLAATVANGALTLSWTAADGATGYRVMRQTLATGEWSVLAESVTGTSCTDSAAASVEGYVYRVTSLDADGMQGGTAELAEVPMAAFIASRAPDFTANSARITAAPVITWEFPAAASFDQIRVYRFLKGERDLPMLPIATVAASVTSYTDESAAFNVDYEYAVAAFDSVRGIEGWRSALVSAKSLGRCLSDEVTVSALAGYRGTLSMVTDGDLTLGARAMSGAFGMVLQTPAQISAVRV